MVKINYCPSCGAGLNEKSFICPVCDLDIEELFAKGYLLMSNTEDNSIELFDGNEWQIIDETILNNSNSDSGDEIVIVVPETDGDDELVIDFDELGIDVENLGEDVNIVIQVDGSNLEDNGEASTDDDELPPNEWYFDDDPYEIVYYEFVNFGD